MGGCSVFETWDSGPEGFIPRDEDCLDFTNLRPIHIPARSTRGTPIPRLTPKPILRSSVFELAPAGGVTGVCELLWEGVLEIELAIMLLAKEVDDVKAVVLLVNEVDDAKAVDEVVPDML